MVPARDRMPLPQELQNLEIEQLKSINEAAPWNLQYPSSPKTQIKDGASSIVYEIRNPGEAVSNALNYSFACKQIDFDEEWKIGVARAEILVLKDLEQRVIPHTTRLVKKFYVDSEQGGSLYLVFRPWVDLSLEDLIEFLVGKSRPDSISTLKPCYERDFIPDSDVMLQLWLGFIERSLTFLSMIQSQSNDITFPPEVAQALRHKDIKPDNVLLAYWIILSPQFVDYGLSKAYIPAARSKHVGTRRYLGPQQQPGSPPHPNSDVFPLGCCFIFIEALIHSGSEGVSRIYDVVVDSEGFLQNIDIINDILEQPPTYKWGEENEQARRSLRKMVKTHMATKHSDNIRDGRTLLSMFLEILEPLSKPDIFETPMGVFEVSRKFKWG